MSALVIQPDSALHATFAATLASADMIFFAGLPGVGKSLLLQQMALMAADAGRPVTLLQWDVTRQPFETPRYPLQDGATHPLVIKAVGAWLRRALPQWAAGARNTNALLLGEAPLIGGRFMEVCRPADDAAEALLRGQRTRFLLPVPSVELRAHIEAQRQRSIAAPRHQNEAHDAPPDLLRALWRDLQQVAVSLGLAPAASVDAPYSPAIYAAVYRHLLRRRQVTSLDLRRPLPAATSVYAGLDELPQLQADPAEAAAILAELEAAPTAERAWYAV